MHTRGSAEFQLEAGEYKVICSVQVHRDPGFGTPGKTLLKTVADPVPSFIQLVSC